MIALCRVINVYLYISFMRLSSLARINQNQEETRQSAIVRGDIISERVRLVTLSDTDPPVLGGETFTWQAAETGPFVSEVDQKMEEIIVMSNELSAFMGTTGEITARTIAAQRGGVETFFKAFVLPWDVKPARQFVKDTPYSRPRAVEKVWFNTVFMPRGIDWGGCSNEELMVTYRPANKRFSNSQRGKPWISAQGTAAGYDAGTDLARAHDVYILEAPGAADTLRTIFSFQGEVDTSEFMLPNGQGQGIEAQGLYYFTRFGSFHPAAFMLFPVKADNARHVIGVVNTLMNEHATRGTQLNSYVMLGWMLSDCPLHEQVNDSELRGLCEEEGYAVAEFDWGGTSYVFWDTADIVFRNLAMVRAGAQRITVIPLYPTVIDLLFGPPFHFLSAFSCYTRAGKYHEEARVSRIANHQQESDGLEPSIMTMELPGTVECDDFIGSITQATADKVIALKRIEEASPMRVPRALPFSIAPIPASIEDQMSGREQDNGQDPYQDEDQDQSQDPSQDQEAYQAEFGWDDV